MIYDVNGGQLSDAFDTGGITMGYAFDIDGNPLITPKKKKLRVMTYNPQWFTGINAQQEMQLKIMQDNNPDIIGFQEFVKSGIFPSVAQKMLSGYGTILLSSLLYAAGIASKMPMYDVYIKNFDAQDPADEGEERKWMKAYFDFNGKKVCLINTHLSYITQSYIYAQFAEVFTVAEQEENVIILADFNTNFDSFETEFYQRTFKPFVDAGYKFANNSPLSGITKTFTRKTSAETLADFSSNPDSIIVSGNIDIDEVNFDTTKLSYLNGDAIDHIAVAASVYI